MMMRKVPETTRRRLAGLTGLLAKDFPGQIKSVLLFGSAAGGDYLPDRSDLNLLIVAADLPAAQVLQLKDFLVKKASFLGSHPLLLSQDELAESCDIFPLEFLAIRKQYQVLAGADVLAGLKFDSQDLRRQCEREVKGKLINLRQAFLDKRLDLSRLLSHSFKSFIPVFGGLLELRGLSVPANKSELVAETAKTYGLDLAVWDKLHQLSLRAVRLSRSEAQALFTVYLDDVAKLARTVDRL